MAGNRHTVRSTQTPIGETILHVAGLGDVTGLLYANGVRQFLGIPYARLPKRWTRSTLADSWPNNTHDGRDLGSQAPNPAEFRETGELTPIDTFAHLTEPKEDEATCLVLNITIPPEAMTEQSLLPVMFYIHGGAFLFGGGNRSIFDCVNLVSRSMTIGKPVVAINMNYRVGFGGFLASQDILDDMRKDGFPGVGNWGLTDQQVAFDWVQHFIRSFGGDKGNVTAYGLSAGGISIGHQLKAKNPPVFHRAICMSGVGETVPAMSLEDHEKIYQDLLAHFKIESKHPDRLEQLRAIPEMELADATLAVYNRPSAVSSPCNDGVFHDSLPNGEYISPPSWLKSYMVGDVREEGEIFLQPLGAGRDYDWFRDAFAKFMSVDEAEMVLALYDVKAGADAKTLRAFMQTTFGDSAFGLPQRKNLQASKLPETYGYHFDLPSKIKNSLHGICFHALDLQYVFLNMHDDLDEQDIAFGHVVCDKYIRFAYGVAPWKPYHPDRAWGVFTENYTIEIRTEEEDEKVRHYSRWDTIEKRGLMPQFQKGYRFIRNNYTDMREGEV